jgi:hypothetical protein
MLPKKRSEGVFYELYTVRELISHAASGFVSVWHDRQEVHKVRTEVVASISDSLSAGTGATRVWVVAVCPTTTESDVKDKRLGRKEGIGSAVSCRQKGIGNGPGIRIRVTRKNILGDRLALKVPYPKTVAVP